MSSAKRSAAGAAHTRALSRRVILLTKHWHCPLLARGDADVPAMAQPADVQGPSLLALCIVASLARV